MSIYAPIRRLARDGMAVVRMDSTVAKTLILSLLLVAALLPCSARALPTLSVPAAMAGIDTVPLNPVLEYVSVDPRQSFEQVLALDDSHWQPVAGARGFGYSKKAHWFRVRLQGLDALGQPIHARLNFAHHDLVEFVAVSDGRVVSRVSTGDSKPFDSRAVDTTAFVFPLTGHGQQAIDLYVGVWTPGSLIVPLDLITEQALVIHDQIELAWLAGYFAVIGIIFLNNLFIYGFVRDRTYLYYLTYLLSVGCLVFLLQGAAFRYLWPDAPELNNPFVLALTPLTLMLASLFVIRFLNLREVGDPYDYQLMVAFGGLFALLFAASWVLPYHLHIRLGLVLSLVVVFFGFYLGIKYSWRGFRAARVFALAWFVYLFFVVIYILDVAGVIQPTALTRNAFVIGSALELALLSIAFADRFNQEKKQRIAAQYHALEAQQNLNDQLDSLVRSRTSELERANRELERLSLSDPLTGLSNRRHFDQQARLEFERARRTGTPLSIAIVDVDYFKRVNDNHGHDVGDRCLIEIAGAIRNEVQRPADVAARFGGEELAVILPDCDQEGASTVAERIRTAIARLAVPTDTGAIHVTASVGLVSCVPTAATSLEQMLKTADQNLYQAKAGGRNRVVSSGL